MTQYHSHGAQIVPLWKYRRPMDTTVQTEMRAHWDQLRAGRLMPLRSEIDPRSIENGLEYAFLVERTQPGHVRLRVAGMHLCDLMSMEVRGMPLRAFLQVGSRALFTSRLERVFETPEIQLHHLISDDQGQSALNAQMLILPLKGDNGQVDRALGCIVTEGTIGPFPRRFRLLETDVTCLRTGTETSAKSREVEQAPKVSGFAEDQRPFGMPNLSSVPIGTREDGRPDFKVVQPDAD